MFLYFSIFFTILWNTNVCIYEKYFHLRNPYFDEILYFSVLGKNGPWKKVVGKNGRKKMSREKKVLEKKPRKKLTREKMAEE